VTSPVDPKDAYDAVGGGLSILLKSDAVMTALGRIGVEPGFSEITMDEILTSVAQNWNDFQSAARKRLEDEA
jgi:hypothetical protein